MSLKMLFVNGKVMDSLLFFQTSSKEYYKFLGDARPSICMLSLLLLLPSLDHTLGWPGRSSWAFSTAPPPGHGHNPWPMQTEDVYDDRTAGYMTTGIAPNNCNHLDFGSESLCKTEY